MAENQPTDPGTQPTLVIDPADGQNVEAPTFTFPLGIDKKPETGPFGPKQSDASPRDTVPKLGVPSIQRTPQVFTFPTSLGTPVNVSPLDVRKPTTLLFYQSDLVAADNAIEVFYFPEVSHEQFLDDNNGFKWNGMDLFLWAPGRWYIGAIVTTFVRTLTYMQIETESAEMQDKWREPRGLDMQLLNDVVLGAAAVTTLLPFQTVVRCARIEVQNVGANTMRVVLGSAIPSATRAIEIRPGATYVFEGNTLPTAQIRGFSTAGTSAQVIYSTKPWIL